MYVRDTGEAGCRRARECLSCLPGPRARPVQGQRLCRCPSLSVSESICIRVRRYPSLPASESACIRVCLYPSPCAAFVSFVTIAAGDGNGRDEGLLPGARAASTRDRLDFRRQYLEQEEEREWEGRFFFWRGPPRCRSLARSLARQRACARASTRTHTQSCARALSLTYKRSTRAHNARARAHAQRGGEARTPVCACCVGGCVRARGWVRVRARVAGVRACVRCSCACERQKEARTRGRAHALARSLARSLALALALILELILKLTLMLALYSLSLSLSLTHTHTHTHSY